MAQSDMIQVSKERTSRKVGEVNIMRTFLICEEKINFNTGKPESFKIKGMYSGLTFPSTIQNNPEY